jgi:glycosyltransferase involved in cell wall biosynthesis
LTAKKDILILCDWFLPGYLAGGPIQSIANLTQELSDEFNFKIITTDRDFKSNKSYENIKSNEWTNFENRTVFYVSPENLNESFLLALIKNTPHDAIYLNSLFSKHFTINVLKWKAKHKINSNIVLAPRGMFSNGALAIKPLKKKLFFIYAKFFGLFNTIYFQATTKQEASEIKLKMGSHVIIKEASNLPHSASDSNPVEKKVNELNLFSISRISPIKNINFAIDILKEIKTLNVTFDVFGPIEDRIYWETCLENAKKLPNNILFNYKGIAKPNEIGDTISKYHALFLPTQNENFGHIIVETLQHGRPVVISDQTPWRNLENNAVGFDISLTDKQKFVNAIEKLGSLNQSEFNPITTDCVSYINSKLNREEIKKQYINLFNA